MKEVWLQIETQKWVELCLQMYELKYFVYIPEKLEDAKKDLEELNRQKQDAVWS